MDDFFKEISRIETQMEDFSEEISRIEVQKYKIYKNQKCWQKNPKFLNGHAYNFHASKNRKNGKFKFPIWLKPAGAPKQLCLCLSFAWARFHFMLFLCGWASMPQCKSNECISEGLHAADQVQSLLPHLAEELWIGPPKGIEVKVFVLKSDFSWSPSIFIEFPLE